MRSLLVLSLLVGGLLVTGCGGVNPARTPPRPPVERVQLDPFGLFQELCPSSSAPLQSTNHSCDARDLAAYARRLAAFGRDNWYPGELAKRQHLYGNIYAGRALTTVVHMRIDSVGQIADSGIQYSSGSDMLDSSALAAFHPGTLAPEPPTCALTEGAFVFRLGLCVQVLRSGEIGWPELPAVTPRPSGPEEQMTSQPAQPRQKRPPSETHPPAPTDDMSLKRRAHDFED